MRRSETVKLSELIKQSISANKLGDGIDKVRVKEIWKDLTGEFVTNATTDIYYDKGKLYVSINSSIIRSELLIIRSELVKRINSKLGRNFINEIIVR